MQRILTVSVLIGLFAGMARAEPAFIRTCRELAEQASTQGSSVIDGLNDWLFFASELRHLGAGPFWGDAAETASRATRADARDPLPAILAFHHDLQTRGVQLILVPVPPKAVAYERMLPDHDKPAQDRPDIHHRAFYDLLREQGLMVLDLTDVFRREEKEHGAWYCRQDTHWSGVACVTAAEHIAEQVGPMLDTVGRKEFVTEWRTIEITGDIWRMLDDPSRPKEAIPVRAVQGAAPEPRSPVLLLGDSHTLVFHAGGDMHYAGAGLADQLAVELGIPVDVVGVRGSGATPARINLLRRVQRDPAYWDRKKVVVWVFAAREFTESDGWRIVPIAP